MTPSPQVLHAFNTARRDRSYAEVAARCVPSLHPKTVQRLLSGRTYSPTTLRLVARALRVDLTTLRDSASPSSGAHGQDGAEIGKPRRALSPVVGWKAAAQVLEVSPRTLYDARRAAGDRRKPWWPSAEALGEWFEQLAVTGW